MKTSSARRTQFFRYLTMLALALLTTWTAGSTALAADGQVTVESKSGVKPGDTITLDVSLTGTPGVAAFEFDLSYDTKVLELTEAQAGDFPGTQFSDNKADLPFKCMWYDPTQENVTADSVICKLTFRVSSTISAATSTTVSVDYTPGDVYRTERPRTIDVNPQKINGLVTFSAPRPDTYTVDVNAGPNGTASASKTKELSAGETVTVTATPDSYYTVDKITWAPKGGGSATDITSSKSFTMPAANVTVEVSFKPVQVASGRLVVESKEARTGDSVTVPVRLDENPGVAGFEFDISYDRSKLELTDAKEGDFSGTQFSAGLSDHPYKCVWTSATQENMTRDGTVCVLTFRVRDSASGTASISVDYAAGDVFGTRSQQMYNVDPEKGSGTITIAQLPTTYKVSVNAGANGKASASETTGVLPGKTVTVTATPNSGYMVDKITWTPEGGSATDITSSRSFTMPAADVAVDVTFQPVPGSGRLVVESKSAKAGDLVTIPVRWEKNPGVAGFEFDISYDRSKLELTDAKEGDFSGTQFSAGLSDHPYKCVWTSATQENMTRDGTVCVLTFRVRDSASGTASISVDYAAGDVFGTRSQQMYNVDPEKGVGTVTIGAAVYQISVNAGANGKASASKTTGVLGETVTVTATPNSGYMVDKITWTPEGGSATDITSSRSFTMPAANVTVNVTFRSALTYTVTFNANGGSVGISSSKTDTSGRLSSLPTATFTGHVFDGWYTQSSGGTRVTTDTVFTKDTTVYAHWTQSGYTISISTVSGGQLTADRSSATAGTVVHVTATPGNGYQLDKITWTPEGGSATDITTSRSFTMPAANVTVNATFRSVPTYTVSFNANGGSVGTSSSKTDTSGRLSSLPAATRTNYVFNGWYTQSSGGTRVTNDTVFTKDTTVYAHWTQSGYTISVSSATTQGRVTADRDSASSGTTVTLTVSPSTGYGLSSLTVRKSDDTTVSTKQSSENSARYTFVMPSSNVSVSAAFKALQYSVRKGSVTNGSIELDRSSATVGTVVHVTATPGNGYQLGLLTMTPEGGVQQDITASRSFTMPAANVTVSAVFANIGGVFRDIEGRYCEDSANWAYRNHITQGTDATHFSPDQNCTRAQTVTFLWRAAGEPRPASSKNPFQDVAPGTYYYDAVLWAVEKGITKGTTDTTFDPGRKITRAQAVTFLYRVSGSPAQTTYNPFTDVGRSSGSDFYDAILWAVANQITNGQTPTTFEPSSPCTRGQIVTFLYRYMNP